MQLKYKNIIDISPEAFIQKLDDMSLLDRFGNKDESFNGYITCNKRRCGVIERDEL